MEQSSEAEAYLRGVELTTKMMRRFVPSFGELVDRLSITQQKEIFIPEHREVYTKQINDIVHDLNLLIQQNGEERLLTGEMIRAIIIITQMNSWIWTNEANRRNGIEDGNDLSLTHSLNSIRTEAYSFLSQLIGDRGEYKKDTAIPHKDWIPSLFENKTL